MEIDPITIVAQILNFALLVYLLKRFLYQPILGAMDRREQTIDDRLTEARERVKEAEEREEEYLEKTKELEESRREVMEEVRAAARQKSLELHEELRQRVAVREEEWAESLARESAEQLDALRDRFREEIVATVREALADLADRELDEQMLATFLRRVEQLSSEEVEQLRGVERPGPPLTVVTPAPLSDDRRAEVMRRLQERFGEDTRFIFDTDEKLIAGVELRCHGHRLGWNVDDYLDSLEQSVRERLERIVRQKASGVTESEESDARHAVS